MNIAELIPVGSKNAIKREDLRVLSGLDDREMRRAINNSKELIINLSDGRGYFRPAPEDKGLVLVWESTFWKRIRDERERVLKGKEWREALDEDNRQN